MNSLEMASKEPLLNNVSTTPGLTPSSQAVSAPELVLTMV